MNGKLLVLRIMADGGVYVEGHNLTEVEARPILEEHGKAATALRQARIHAGSPADGTCPDCKAAQARWTQKRTGRAG